MSQDKNTEFSNRLESLRDYLNLSKREFARKLKISDSTYNSWTNLHAVPSAMSLKNVHVVTGCNPAWLLTGEGSMFLEPEPKPIKQHEIWVPVYDAIQAGENGRIVSETPLYYLPAPHGIRAHPLYGFNVRGDSMFPTYRQGDVVFATPENKPATGEHVVAQIDWGHGEDPELVLKVWHRAGSDSVRLISLNSNFQPIEIKPENVLNTWRIVGSMWAESAAIMRRETAP